MRHLSLKGRVLLLFALALAGLAGVAWLVLVLVRDASPAVHERLACAMPVEDPNAPHPGMVWVAGGTLSLGDNVYREEQPQRAARVEGFWMDRTEVSNDAFAAFVKATGHITVAERAVDVARHPGLPPEMRQPGAVVFVMPNNKPGGGQITQWWRYLPGANWRHPGGPGTSMQGRGAFPVVAVTAEDAWAYARWKGRSLPSEAQWEWAARAGRAGPAPLTEHAQPTQANTWQGIFPVLNSADDGFVGLAPVGCFKPNALGLFDMIGNVWELTADVWTPDHAAAASAGPNQMRPGLRQTPAANTVGQHVIKGGSFLCAPNYCMRYRAGARQPQDDDLGASHLGFRTLLNAPGPEAHR